MGLELGNRRATTLDISSTMAEGPPPLSDEELNAFTDFDLIYRSLCALMFNYVPTSGHPGGSVSSGRFVACTLFDSIDFDLSDPERPDADLVSYAAGHKALGLYAMWALRNEIARIGCPELLPTQQNLQLRLEDLLGFRRNPVTDTPQEYVITQELLTPDTLSAGEYIAQLAIIDIFGRKFCSSF